MQTPTSVFCSDATQSRQSTGGTHPQEPEPPNVFVLFCWLWNSVLFSSELNDTEAPSSQCLVRLKRNSWFKIVNLSSKVDWTIPNCIESQIQLATKVWSTSLLPKVLQTWITRVLYKQEWSRLSKTCCTMFFWFTKHSQTSCLLSKNISFSQNKVTASRNMMESRKLCSTPHSFQ